MSPTHDEITLTHIEARLEFIDLRDEFGWYLKWFKNVRHNLKWDPIITHQLVKHIMTYNDAAAKVKSKIDHEYATVSSSLSQTLASPLFDRLSSWEIVAVINTEV